jgi:hypothetical protein
VFLATIANAESEKVEIENQWVRVLRVMQAPHDKSPMHEHPASVVVYLTDLQRIGIYLNIPELALLKDDLRLKAFRKKVGLPD